MRKSVQQQSKFLLGVKLATSADPSKIAASDILIAIGDQEVWHPALSWDGEAWAQILVGPGTEVGMLPEGVLDIYTDVTAAPEEPVMKSPIQLSVSAS